VSCGSGGDDACQVASAAVGIKHWDNLPIVAAVLEPAPGVSELAMVVATGGCDAAIFKHEQRVEITTCSVYDACLCILYIHQRVPVGIKTRFLSIICRGGVAAEGPTKPVATRESKSVVCQNNAVVGTGRNVYNATIFECTAHQSRFELLVAMAQPTLPVVI